MRFRGFGKYARSKLDLLREVLPPVDVMRNCEINRICGTPCCDDVT